MVALLEHLNVHRLVAQIQSHSDPFQLVEAQVAASVGFDFERDHVLAALLGVEHVQCEWQIRLVLRPVGVPDRIQSGHGREPTRLIPWADDLLLVPGLLVQLRVRFECEPLYWLERQLGQGIVLLRVVQRDVDYAFDLELAQLTVFVQLTIHLLLHFQHHILQQRVHCHWYLCLLSGFHLRSCFLKIFQQFSLLLGFAELHSFPRGFLCH